MLIADFAWLHASHRRRATNDRSAGGSSHIWHNLSPAHRNRQPDAYTVAYPDARAYLHATAHLDPGIYPHPPAHLHPTAHANPVAN